MDYIFRLKDYIDGLGLFVNDINVSALTDGNSICARPTPSNKPYKYLNKSQSMSYNVQILVRHESEKESLDNIEFIKDKLSKLNKKEIVSNNDSFIFIKCDNTTTPHYVEKDNYGWIYSATFASALYLKN